MIREYLKKVEEYCNKFIDKIVNPRYWWSLSFLFLVLEAIYLQMKYSIF